MTVDSKDVAGLQKALNDAAGKASVIWTTFITFQLYLAIAYGSVTHRDLFLETPIKLPIFNVELPLVAFFAVAPVVQTIFHFYIFLQLFALAGKAKDHDTILEDEVAEKTDREYIRQRLDSFLILQTLAGPSEQRSGFNGYSLKLIAWITLVGAPVAILVQAQLTFLPYHREWVVCLQRIVILIDLALVWYFWPRIRSNDQPIQLRRRLLNLVGVLASFYVVIFTVSIASFPGEWIDKHLPAVRVIPTTWLYLKQANSNSDSEKDSDKSPPIERHLPGWPSPNNWTSLHEWLFGGEVNEVSGKPSSFFSYRLVLTDQNFIDSEKRHSFRGRDLRQAVFDWADLRNSDFSGAMLNGASFYRSNLQNAHFDCADPQELAKRFYRGLPLSIPFQPGHRVANWPNDGCTWLQGASLDWAKLEGASFVGAELQDASLIWAQLQGVSFERAQLSGAALGWARLQSANLNAADLSGGNLYEAQLQGASLNWAHLRATSLYLANLQGASLENAELQGASLDDADLQGALLTSAVLEGASIYGAQLQGADLDFAQVWNLHGSPSIQSFSLVSHGNINWYGPPWGSPDRFDAWRNSILEDITPRMRNEALKRLSTIGPNPDMANVVGEEFWLKLTRESPFGEQFAKGRAAFFIDLACAKGSAPYVARGIIRNQLGFAPWYRNALFADKLQMIRLQHDTCPGAKLFTEQDWALLDKLVDESSSSATSKKKK